MFYVKNAFEVEEVLHRVNLHLPGKVSCLSTASQAHEITPKIAIIWSKISQQSKISIKNTYFVIQCGCVEFDGF